MTEKQNPQQVADDVVVSMDYTLTVDGEFVDKSDAGKPFEFLQGHNNIIPGLEAQIDGMKVGESRQVTVEAKDGYGEFDQAQVMDVPLSEFPENMEPEPGMELMLKDHDGHTLYARVVSVGKARAKLDFNHPLAGKQLTFDVTIVGLRQPTEEELAPGQVHTHGHNHG
jgi:FKBP-type peptidyl-prolyl cis-trans isomerase SlyD